MENGAASNRDIPPLADVSKRVAQRIFVTCENRLQLLLVEAQEERERLLQAFWLGLLIAGSGLLAAGTITAGLVIAFWESHPLILLSALSGLYLLVALWCRLRLARLQREWPTLPGTLEQLRKDRECLEKYLA